MFIPKKVALLARSGDFHLRDIHREEAQALIAEGAAVVNSVKTSGAVESLCLTEGRVNRGVRVGSFGIRREHFPVGNQYGLSGGVVFDHHPLHEKRAA